jgi:hypothetical protein
MPTVIATAKQEAIQRGERLVWIASLSLAMTGMMMIAYTLSKAKPVMFHG